MSPAHFSRREFVVLNAMIGASALGGSLLRARAAASPSQITRKDVRDLSDDEVKKYREAFRRVKEQGPDRPRWNGNQLVLPDASTVSKTGYAFQALLHTNYCPHGNWWFFPWHRVYLFYLEQVLQTAVKDFIPDVPLAIPYWNWTEQQDFPQIFQGDPRTNPLADDRRFSVPLTEDDVGSGVISTTVDQVGGFDDFGSGPACTQRGDGGMSPFEAGPHGIVHMKVGWYDSQGRPGNMRIPPTAAFDPIFWSHHANIDRIWESWGSQPGHSNPAFDTPCDASHDVTWGNLKFAEFVSGGAQPMNRMVEEFLNDPQIKSVVYKKYHRDALMTAQKKPTPKGTKPLEVKAVSATNSPLKLQMGKAVTLAVSPEDDIRKRIHAMAAPDQQQGVVSFRVEGVAVPRGNPPVMVSAFLNKPDATTDTSTKDPHYIGYFTFFGAEHHEGHGEAPSSSFLLNLTPALRRLRSDLDWEKPLTVTLVLQPVLAPPNKKVAVGENLEIPFKSARLLLK